jgi:glutathione S-transferase
MSLYTFDNPVFCVYTIAAALMIAKMMSHSWITVYWMLRMKSGLRLPEDLRKTPLNPDPRPDQLDIHPKVDRWRRIHQNEVENVPLFLAVGFLYVATHPALPIASAIFGAYVLSRFVHFWVVATERTHDARAYTWTVGSLLIYAMAALSLVGALRQLV